MHLGHGVDCEAELECTSQDELPTTLYYHWNPCSSHPREVQGFFGVSETPDSGLWQESLKQQGWELQFRL